VRRVTVRAIGIALILNGLCGIGAVFVGLRMSQTMLDNLRGVSVQLVPEQSRFTDGLRGVAVLVEDASQATAGFGVSMDQAREAVSSGGQSAEELRRTFTQMSELTQVEILGLRPLEALTASFAASASSFAGLSGSLNQTASSLGENARDTVRVTENLRRTRDQLYRLASLVEGFHPQVLVVQGIAQLELGLRLLLALVFLQAALSSLTGLALLLLMGDPPRGFPRDAVRGSPTAEAAPKEGPAPRQA
jgi:ABC-type transporter Mla subunit MlaD